MKAKGALDTLKMIGNGSNPIQGGYKCGESVIIDKLLSLTQLNIFVTLTFVVCLWYWEDIYFEFISMKKIMTLPICIGIQ